MRYALTVIVAMLLSIASSSAQDRFIFTSISHNDGLTSTVNCTYKEKNGDVWLGCPNGLYKFNGSTLLRYEDSAITGQSVLGIDTDRSGNMWVLTTSGPFVRRPAEDEFHPAESSLAEVFYCLCMDKSGIWFGSMSRIYRYTYSDAKLSLFCTLEGLDNFDVKHIEALDERSILCSSHKGLIIVDTLTGEISQAPFGTHKEISDILIDSRGRVWTAFYNNGIEVYEKDGTLIRSFNTANSSLSNDLVLCLEESAVSIWAGTDGGGINIIDKETGSIKILSQVSGDPSSLPAHSIKSFYTDHFGNLWAGSVRNGLIRISRSSMKTYSDCHIGMKTGLSNPTVISLFQENDPGMVWVGTDGEGVNRFDMVTGEFTHYKSTLRKKIVSIASYSESELAISAYADWIWLMNKKTGTIRNLPLQDKEIEYQIKYGGRSMNLANEGDEHILLITNKIRRYSKKTGQCVEVGSPDDRTPQDNCFIIGSTDQGLWIHDNSNIFLLPYQAASMKKIAQTEGSTIRSGNFGPDGIIWLATSAGLEKFDTRTGEISKIETSLFENAVSVVCDRNSRVWVGTDSDLFAYLTSSGSFAMFGDSDGASRNEYLAKPKLLSINGDILMGGVNGLLHINRSFFTETEEEPMILLYGLQVDNEAVRTDKNEKYRLPRNCQHVKIDVSAHETDMFREKRFRFTFAGNIYEKDTPMLELRRMPGPGNYDVMVSCTKRNGEWTEPVKILTLNIPVPWYLTWWFLGCLVTVLGISAWLISSETLRRKEEKYQMAMKEQEHRMFEEKITMLINISHELRTPLTLIMAPLKRLLSSMEADQENFGTLQRIYRQSRRMKDLLNMVLDLRKMEVGKESLKIDKCNFNFWIQDVCEDIIREENDEGINIVLDLDPQVGEVEFDKKKCDTVMTNILMNAVKHSTPEDSITIRTEMAGSDRVRVSVSDEGPGLKDIDESRMFTRFYQSSHEHYGSGIGLSYSKILLELHGGSISAGNNPDKGATFCWEIPVKADKSATAEVPARAYLNELMGYEPDIEAPQGEMFSTAGMTLMLVDDNHDLLEFLREALCAEFGEIILSYSGNQTMTMLNSGKVPDIIVSDVNMPDGDGFRLCQSIKNDNRFSHIPVILLTARGEGQSQGDSYRVGAEGYMAKPFEVETLMELIRSILRRKSDIKKKYLDTNQEEEAAFSSKDEDFILRLNRLISEHISDPELDQQLICRELGVSRALLYNRMKAITGGGAKEYITRIRLEKAKSLIESTDLSIVEISEMTGFSTQSYFSTAFKNYTGKTPSQYKQSAKKDC